ncbi:MAG TPA: DUF4276 family protein [bacterium]|nr:DUF4276 family protein [bacterium]
MVRLFVEGGGESEFLHAQCREAFSIFLKKAGFEGRMPRLVACGDRGTAFDKFRTAVISGEDAFLLVDSEASVGASVKKSWIHLKGRENWSKPKGATDDMCHLMVQCIEAWFLADKQVLTNFFGQGFNPNALPKNADIEQIAKDDVYRGLERASAHCKTKAPYGKGEHSFKILAKIDPTKVRTASPWADRFLVELGKVV